jgi:hypothetical protein
MEEWITIIIIIIIICLDYVCENYDQTSNSIDSENVFTGWIIISIFFMEDILQFSEWII